MLFALLAAAVAAPAAQAGAPLDPNVDLLTDTGVQTRIDGAGPSDFAARSLWEAGDFNGDGLDDVVVGANGADNNARNSAGSVYVVYGRAGADPANVDLASTDAAGTSRFMRIDGALPNDQQGYAVSTPGDFNGDGNDDIVMSAINSAQNGRPTSGSAWVVYGQDTADPADIDLASTDAAVTDRYFRVDGATANDLLGFSVAGAGDVNGDGNRDIVVGAAFADFNGRGNSGSSYVVYGQDGADPANLDLGSTAAADTARWFRIDSATAGDFGGTSVAGAGDVNGDGVSDVIVSAYAANPLGRSGAGSAFIVYGQSAADPENVDLASTTPEGAARYMRVNGGAAGDTLSAAVEGAGDINGDGRDDVVILATAADSNGRTDNGSAYLVYGQTTADPADLDLASAAAADTARYFRVDGAAQNDFQVNGFPPLRSVAGAGDINGDGIADLIVGAPQADSNGRANSGSAYVISGLAAADPADIDLASTDAAATARYFRIDGATAGEQAGATVAPAGDPNADAGNDVLVGAVVANNNDRGQSGSAYIVSYDSDGGGVADASEDPDGDGIGNAIDNCPGNANADQANGDKDELGNECDGDDDGDGTPDGDDAFPLNEDEQTDTDGDTIGNKADTDDDNDGTSDGQDAFPLNAAERADTDGDGTGNNADTDDDGDNVEDGKDVFPLDKSEQKDTDGDGIGDNADTDDGVGDNTNTVDNRPKPNANPKPTPPVVPRVVPPVVPPVPGPIQPALLVKQAAPAAALISGRLRLVSGLAVVCPRGGPACRAIVSFKTLRRSKATGRVVKVFVTPKGGTMTVAPGTTRVLAPSLTRYGGRLLRRVGTLRVTARAILRAGTAAPIVRKETLRIEAPGSGR